MSNWGGANRPIVSNKLGAPSPNEGTDGDMQVMQTNLGGKLFGKLGGRWYDVPLGIDGVTRFGTSLSNHLSIDRDSVDITKDSNKVASFGATVTIGEVGSSKSNVYITAGKVQIRNNEVVQIELDASGNITMTGVLRLTNAVGADNIAIGSNISTSMESGGGNICIGSFAGASLGSGGLYNTLVGAGRAGHAITSGDRNICLGRYAGHDDSPSGEITTADNQICLGADTITDLFCKQGTIQVSDERDKADIEDFNVGLDFVNKMRPVTYRWDMRSFYWEEDEDGNRIKYPSDGSKKESEIQVGFIAQEVQILEQEVGYSELKDDGQVDQDTELIVNTTSDCSKLGFQYGKLSTVLVNAIQELSAKVDTMQEEINNLK